MRSLLVGMVVTFFFCSCENENTERAITTENWMQRSAQIPVEKELKYGKSYLSVYSQIYSHTEHRTHNLTAMISMRNMSDTDTIYLLSAKYYGTSGAILHSYFGKPIYLAPLETTEIIINETDTSGGTGSNFLFEWKVPENAPAPLFEAIMTSTMGQQGLSFVTQAKQVL